MVASVRFAIAEESGIPRTYALDADGAAHSRFRLERPVHAARSGVERDVVREHHQRDTRRAVDGLHEGMPSLLALEFFRIRRAERLVGADTRVGDETGNGDALSFFLDGAIAETPLRDESRLARLRVRLDPHVLEIGVQRNEVFAGFAAGEIDVFHLEVDVLPQ